MAHQEGPAISDRISTVAVVTTVHAPGDTRIWHKQVRSLAAAGHRVHYVAGPLEGLEFPAGVQAHDLGAKRPGIGARLGRIREAVRRVRSIRPDVVHIHDPELLALGWFGRAPGRRLIYDVHENVRQQLRLKPRIPSPLRPLVATVYGMVERLTSPRISRFILAEESYAPIYGGRPVTIVKNYPVLDPAVASEATEPRTVGDELVVCYVGGVSVVRGALDLIDALPRLVEARPAARLILAGPLQGLEREALLDRAQRLGVGDRIELPGRVAYEEGQRLMSEATVGVAPLHAVGNYVESLPTKMFEYMRWGCRSWSATSRCGAATSRRRRRAGSHRRMIQPVSRRRSLIRSQTRSATAPGPPPALERCTSATAGRSRPTSCSRRTRSCSRAPERRPDPGKRDRRGALVAPTHVGRARSLGRRGRAR